MDNFRLILIGGGITLVVAIFLWDRARRAAHARRQRVLEEMEALEQAEGGETRDDLLDGEWSVGPVRVSRERDDLDALESLRGLNTAEEAETDDTGTAVELQPEPQSGPEPEPAPALVHEPKPASDDSLGDEEISAEVAAPVDELRQRFLVLTLLAGEGKQLHGGAIRAAAKSRGLVHGAQGFFEQQIEGQTLFSMANILEPGTLNADELEQLKTPGLLLFMQLPGPLGLERATDTFIDAGRRLASELNARLADQQRQPLDEQALVALRDRFLNG